MDPRPARKRNLVEFISRLREVGVTRYKDDSIEVEIAPSAQPAVAAQPERDIAAPVLPRPRPRIELRDQKTISAVIEARLNPSAKGGN